MSTAAAVLGASTGPAEQFEAGPTGLFVVALLAIGVFFLGRSMIKHLKRVPPSFDPPAGDPGRPVDPDSEDKPADRT